MTRLRRLRALLAGEAGFSLPELLAVMATLGIVLTGVTTVSVAGTRSQVELDRRFQAQLNARLALDRLRREVHSATLVEPSGASRIVRVTQPLGGVATWCTRGSGTRLALVRFGSSQATCPTTGGELVADFLTFANAFNYSKVAGRLGTLRVDLRVNVTPTVTRRRYALVDDLVLRNGSR